MHIISLHTLFDILFWVGCVLLKELFEMLVLLAFHCDRDFSGNNMGHCNSITVITNHTLSVLE